MGFLLSVRSIRIRIAERAYNKAIGEAVGFSRGKNWNATVQLAFNQRSDRAASAYAKALAA